MPSSHHDCADVDQHQEGQMSSTSSGLFSAASSWLKRKQKKRQSKQAKKYEPEEEKAEKAQELNDTICVRYDLWDNHPDDHRKHGKRRGGSSHSKGHDRPRDKRSAASYMKSFRAFKQRCEKSELVDATSTPRYTSFGITADSNMPPSYWELPRHRGR